MLSARALAHACHLPRQDFPGVRALGSDAAQSELLARDPVDYSVQQEHLLATLRPSAARHLIEREVGSGAVSEFLTDADHVPGPATDNSESRSGVMSSRQALSDAMRRANARYAKFVVQEASELFTEPICAANVWQALCTCALHGTWEVRHGALTAVRCILQRHAALQPGRGLVMQALAVCLQVLQRDRFADFRGDALVAPVRLVAAQALAAAMACPQTTPMDGAGILRDLVAMAEPASNWNSRLGAALACQSLAASRALGSAPPPWLDAIRELSHTLLKHDVDDEVRAVAAEAVLSLLPTAPSDMSSLWEVVWSHIPNLNDLSSSTSACMRLASALVERGCAPAGAGAHGQHVWHLLRHHSAVVRSNALRLLAHLRVNDAQPETWLRVLMQSVLLESLPELQSGAQRALIAYLDSHSPRATRVSSRLVERVVQSFVTLAATPEACPLDRDCLLLIECRKGNLDDVPHKLERPQAIGLLGGGTDLAMRGCWCLAKLLNWCADEAPHPARTLRTEILEGRAASRRIVAMVSASMLRAVTWVLSPEQVIARLASSADDNDDGSRSTGRVPASDPSMTHLRRAVAHACQDLTDCFLAVPNVDRNAVRHVLAKHGFSTFPADRMDLAAAHRFGKSVMPEILALLPAPSSRAAAAQWNARADAARQALVDSVSALESASDAWRLLEDASWSALAVAACKQTSPPTLPKQLNPLLRPLLALLQLRSSSTLPLEPYWAFFARHSITCVLALCRSPDKPRLTAARKVEELLLAGAAVHAGHNVAMRELCCHYAAEGAGEGIFAALSGLWQRVHEYLPPTPESPALSTACNSIFALAAQHGDRVPDAAVSAILALSAAAVAMDHASGAPSAAWSLHVGCQLPHIAAWMSVAHACEDASGASNVVDSASADQSPISSVLASDSTQSKDRILEVMSTFCVHVARAQPSIFVSFLVHSVHEFRAAPALGGRFRRGLARALSDAAAVALYEIETKAAVPGSVCLIEALMDFMTSSADRTVRERAAACFSRAVELMPLDSGIPDPPDWPSKLVHARAQGRAFIQSLLQGAREEGPGADDDDRSATGLPELRPYQRQGVSWLCFLSKHRLCGALCDDLGLGKSVMTLRAIAHTARNETGHACSLVVCPSTLVDNWCREVSKWQAHDMSALRFMGDKAQRAAALAEALEGHGTKHTVVITSYGVALKEADVLSNLRWLYAVLDEAHHIRNPDASTTAAVKRLGSVAAHRLVLTGTPIHNDVTDIWSLFDFLMPGYLGSREEFELAVCRPIRAARENLELARAMVENRGLSDGAQRRPGDSDDDDDVEEEGDGELSRLAQGDAHNPPSQREQEKHAVEMRAGEALESLHRRVLPFVLRRLKSDVLAELPPKTVQDVVVHMSGVQAALYASLRDEMTGFLAGSDSKHVFLKLRELLEVCSHPLLALRRAAERAAAARDRREEVCIARRIAAVRKEGTAASAKFAALRELFFDAGIGEPTEDLSGTQGGSAHRALVFAQWRSTLELLETELFGPGKALEHVRYLRLDGSVPVAQRMGVVDRFNNDESVGALLTTTSVGGQGLTLTGADVVIFVEHDWNPMNDLQAMDRAHRLGQTRSVTVYRLITRDSVEERLMGVQNFKVMVAGEVVGRDNAELATMRKVELMDVLGRSTRGDAGEVHADKRPRLSEADQTGISAGAIERVLDDVGEQWVKDRQEYVDEFALPI